MNPGIENADPQPEQAQDADPSAHPPANWREALLALIATRVELIRLEAGEAARATGVRALLGLAAAACGFFAWALLLVAGTSLAAHLAGWHWHVVALIAAAIHLIAAALLVRALRRPMPPAFPHTGNEFRKDRQWIENLQNPRKS
jgi:MFS family permease